MILIPKVVVGRVVAKKMMVGVLAIMVLWVAAKVVGERVNKNMPIIVGHREVVTKRVTGAFMVIVPELNYHNQ